MSPAASRSRDRGSRRPPHDRHTDRARRSGFVAGSIDVVTRTLRHLTRMRRMLPAVRPLTALMVVAVMASPARAQLSAAEIVAALRDGGHVVYFRHGATTWSGVDRIEWPRERQRLLSEQGIEQSRTIGEAFRRHAIPVGEVLASPFARCRDMAEIAFGRVDERAELIGLLSDGEGRDERIAFMRDRVATAPEPGTNRVIVAHRSNIAAVVDVSLEEGEAVVLRPDGADGPVVLGTLAPEDW